MPALRIVAMAAKPSGTSAGDLPKGEEKAQSRVEDRTGPDHDAVTEQVQRYAGEDSQCAPLLLTPAHPGLDVADGSVEADEGSTSTHERQQGDPRETRCQGLGHQLEAHDGEDDAGREVQRKAERAFGDAKRLGEHSPDEVPGRRQCREAENEEVPAHVSSSPSATSSPSQASRPSWTAKAAMTKPATGSSHGHPTKV